MKPTTKAPAKKKEATRRRKASVGTAKKLRPNDKPSAETVLPDTLSGIYTEEELALFDAVAYGFAKLTVQAYEEKHGLQ